MAENLKAARERLKAAQDALKALLDEAKGDDGETRIANITSVENVPSEIARLTTEMNAAGAGVDACLAKALADAEAGVKRWNAIDPADRPRLPGDPGQVDAPNSLGEEFTAWDGFKGYVRGTPSPELATKHSLKALFQSSAGFEPDRPRIPDVVPIARRPVQLLDRLRQVPIALDQVRYMEQTTRTIPAATNAAAGAVYNEATFLYTERTVNVIKKGIFVPATEEQLDDVPGIQAILSSELPEGLSQAIDADILGTNTADTGLLGVRGLTGRNTHARGTDEPVMTAILTGIRDVETVGRATADLIAMNSSDWYGLLETQDLTGLYILGAPSAEAVQRLWGRPVVKADALPAGDAIVGDFGGYCVVRDRQDVRTRIAPRWDVDTSGATGQTRPTGQINIFSDVRLAVVWRRHAAFTHVTGI